MRAAFHSQKGQEIPVLCVAVAAGVAVTGERPAVTTGAVVTNELRSQVTTLALLGDAGLR